MAGSARPLRMVRYRVMCKAGPGRRRNRPPPLIDAEDRAMTTKTKDHETVRIELSSEQKAQATHATGKSGDVPELAVEELEERIAPNTYGSYWRR